jgi:hypothetical protein
MHEATAVGYPVDVARRCPGEPAVVRLWRCEVHPPSSPDASRRAACGGVRMKRATVAHQLGQAHTPRAAAASQRPMHGAGGPTC